LVKRCVYKHVSKQVINLVVTGQLAQLKRNFFCLRPLSNKLCIIKIRALMSRCEN